jgi:hypothetical protein
MSRCRIYDFGALSRSGIRGVGMCNQFARVACLIAVIAALALPTLGQPVSIPLRVTGEIATPTVPVAVFAPAVGNHGFYTEYDSRDGPEAAIHWISEDGQRSIVYNLAGVPRSGDRSGYSLFAADYTPVPGGGLAALGVWHTADGKYRGHSIVTFDQEGSPASVIDLSDSIDPIHIASFGGGIFLVLGGAHSGTGLGTSEINLVDAHGTVMARHLFEKLDAPESPPPPAQDEAASGDEGGQQQTGDAQYPNTRAWQLFYQVSKTKLVPGDDANVYVIPPDQARKLFVVNKGGEVTQLALDPVPELQNKNVVVMGAVERAGQLAIYYGVVAAHTPIPGTIDLREKFLCLYDVHIGALEVTYQVSDPRIGAFLAEFDSGKFYFLSVPLDPVTHVRRSGIVVAAP